MKTYQDFLEASAKSEREKLDFLLAAINDHKAGTLYKTAEAANLYYMGENPTINRYEKILYDMQGKAHKDMWSANHKIASQFFQRTVDQSTGYLLGNGVTFKKTSTKDKLGTRAMPLDQQVIRAARYALIDGVAYGFWNLDHVEVFRIRDDNGGFLTMPDEEDGSIKAGIRYWQLDADKPLRVTLFEPDGYTEYIRRKNEDFIELTPKRAYIVHSTGSAVDRARGTVTLQYENYPGFPIVPLKNNDAMRSEICGKRNTIDARDIAASGMVNNTSEGAIIYWVLNNCGGMDDLDDAQFLDRLRLTHVAHTDSGSGTTIEPHTVDAPVEGNQATVEMLDKQLYKDFQAFDSDAVSAGNQTATAIEACYTDLDLKTDNFETQVTAFLNGIMALAGVDDEPTYTRNRILNRQEEVQTVIMAAQYFDNEYMTRKLLTILGDADQADEILKRMAADEMERFGGGAGEGNSDGESDGKAEEIDGAESLNN